MPKKVLTAAQDKKQVALAPSKPTTNSSNTYRLKFLPSAQSEWDKLDGSLQLQFTKVLAKRLITPRNPKAALASLPDCYKIKLRGVGYRLVYKVIDSQLILLTVAVGKRDKSAVYVAAQSRTLQQ